MLLKQYGPDWPPNITIATGEVTQAAGLEDTVLSVKKCANPKSHLLLSLRNERGAEYKATVTVPASLQERILISIVRKKDITLREVGELPIS